jgi:hypothetical protein
VFSDKGKEAISLKWSHLVVAIALLGFDTKPTENRADQSSIGAGRNCCPLGQFVHDDTEWDGSGHLPRSWHPSSLSPSIPRPDDG